MSEFTVDTQKLKTSADQLKTNIKVLNNVVSEIGRIKGQLNSSESFTQIKKVLGNIERSLTSDKTKLNVMTSAMKQIASKYEGTEKIIISTLRGPVTSIAWISGMLATSGKILGFDSRAEAKWDLFGASFDKSIASGLKWKYDKDKNGNIIKKLDELSLIDAKISGEAHVAQGSLNGSIGALSGEAGVVVGSVAANGSMTASLFKGGKFAPQIRADAEASAVALKGEAKGRAGSDEHNVHIKGEGKLGSAKASAKAGVGRINVEDEKTGEIKTVTGVKAEAKAEAYAAEGRASGGITIFGIDIDVGVTGKAGGIGGSAGLQATTGGVSGSISAGLGFGLGVDISIDWSGFKLW